MFMVAVLSPPVGAAVPKVLVPVLDDQTFMVIRLDVTTAKIDALADEILNMIQNHVGDAGVAAFKDDVGGMRTDLSQMLASFQDVGGQEVYFVWSQYDFPMPFIAVPVNSAGKAQKLIEYLKEVTGTPAELLSSDLIVAGEPHMLARIKQVSLQSGLPIESAFTSAGTADCELLLAPNAGQRRIITEMLPAVPLASGNIPTQSLIENLHWGLIQFNTPPQMSLRMTLASQDATQAQSLQTAIKETCVTIGQHPGVKEWMPRVDGVLNSLIPQRDGSRLVMEMDREDTDKVMREFIAPSLLEIRRKATRLTCGTNMSGLGKAMLIYANDYEDELPLKWDDFKLVEMTDKGMVCPAVKIKGSFIYRGAGLTCAAPVDMVIIHDKKGNHREGRNVLFLDSRVEWLSEDRFQDYIRKDNQWRREHDMPEIPPQ